MNSSSRPTWLSLTLLMVCALSACAPPVDRPDAMADGGATAMDGTMNDGAASDAAPCADLSGAFSVTTLCGADTSQSQYCITQTGCAITIHTLVGGSVHGTVVGNTGHVMHTSTDGDGGVQMEDCTFTVEDGTITESCDNVVFGVRERCTGSLTRITNDRASSFCCDPGTANSCGEGKRCNLAARSADSTVNTTYTACMPNGTIPEGMPCTRVAGLLGTDDCVAGTTCANFNQPTPAMRTCQRTCASNAGCRAGEICRRFGYAPSSGICVPTCTIGGMDCPTGTTCRTELSIPASGMPLDLVSALCVHTGPTPLGARCMEIPCGPNADCFYDPMMAGTPIAICRQTCSPTVACPAGQTCRPRRLGAENPDLLGHCYPS